MKKRVLIIVSIVLALIIGAGVCLSAYLMAKQPTAITNDQTQEQAEQSEEEQITLENDQVDIKFSPNVKVLASDDASQINNAITSVTHTSKGVRMQVANGTKFDELGVGDIFYLEGNEDTPLEQTYIGKIGSVSKNESGASYLITMPAIDEVFDEFHLDTEQVINKENVNVIQLQPGVSVSDGSTLYNSQPESADGGVHTLTFDHTSGNADATQLKDAGFENDRQLFLDYTVDLFKVFGLKDEDDNKSVAYNAADLELITVYKTKTGKCYHLEDCSTLGKSKEAVLLSDVIQEGKLRACKTCDPPISKDYEFEPELTLSGAVGFSEIDLRAVCDWDIMNGKGIQNLFIEANGTFSAKATLESSIEFKWGEDATELEVGPVKIQGINKKSFPIAYIGYNCFFTPVEATGNYALDTATKGVPLTVGAMIYVDISGKVSVTGTVSLEYTRNFNIEYALYRDGQRVEEAPKYNEGDNDLVISLSDEIAFEMDAHIGASALLHVFNVNVIEIAIIKIGAEAEGAASISYQKSLIKDTVGEFESKAHLYFRIYLKMFELNVNISASVSLFGADLLSLGFSYSKPLINYTIWSAGTKKPTRYNTENMSYTHVTAKKDKLLFFKDINGDLVREENNFRKVIYNGDFFSICGIDESYIYLLIPEGGDTYTLHRVALDGSSDRDILTGIYSCLLQDETYMYYITGFDKSALRRLDRESLKTEVVENFEYDVQAMVMQDGGYYVTIADTFMSFFFGATSYHFLLNKDGDIIKEYGKNPEPVNCRLIKFDDFYVAIDVAEGGYLRTSAAAVYWLSKDKTQHVKTEVMTGWNYFDEGVFTTQQSKSAKEPYELVVYDGKTGVRRALIGLNNTNALFTLAKTADGTWYYFDQTDDEVMLCTMNENMTEKTVVKTFDKKVMPCNLNQCAMQLIDGTIYFYTMPNADECTVLYRYEIA